MSLEQALAANTAALLQLNATLSNNPQLAPSSAPSTAAVAPVPTAPVALTDTSPAPTTAFAPPVPTPPNAAVTVAPPTEAPAVSGEYDSKGMPWDGRIHAATKAKVSDGSWRYRRGCDEAVIKQVETEIRSALSVNPIISTGAGALAGGPAFAPHPFYPETPPVLAAPPVVASVAVPVPPVAPVTTTYEALMAALPPKIVSGELTATQMQQACEQYGVPSIAALSARPDLVPFIAAALGL